MRLVLWMALVGSVAMAVPASAQAQRGDPLRLIPYLRVGFGGDVQVDYDPGIDRSYDSETTVGFGLRLEVPVHEYIMIGGIFQVSFWETELMDDRSTLMDIDFWVRGRIPITLGRKDAELTIGMPIGLTISFLDSQSIFGNDDTGPGWNIGLLFGLQVLFTERLGLMVELGWWRHWAHHEIRGFDGDGTLNQGSFSVGLVIAL